MRNYQGVLKALLILYSASTGFVGAACLIFHPLLEFTWWRVTGVWILMIMGIFIKAALSVMKESKIEVDSKKRL